jgi:hypothetical protein
MAIRYEQQLEGAGAGRDVVRVTGTATLVPQQLPPISAASPSSEHTPVSGRTSATRRAASQSPAIALTTDRACS